MMPAEARRFVSLFGGPRETSDMVGIAKAACAEGYAVVAVRPMGKEAICTLTQRQAAAADRMAANAAREAGKGHWELARHACGLTHAITDPKEAERVFKRLVVKHPDVNIALELSLSRLICVDADNLDEVASFTTLWAERDDVPELVDAAPTVRSPGKRSDDGEWVHKDGGHFWFLLPDDVDFVDSPVATSMPIGAHKAQAQVKFSRSYVLVPPSVRAEGPYVMASDISPAPQWLIDELYLHVEGFQVRRDRHLEPRDGTDSIDVWAALVTWEELLLTDGWTTQGRPDNCGCMIWTRPGDWSSPKSATAHEPGCTRWDTDSVGHGFLHIWTDSPPEFLAEYVASKHSKSLSKLQYISWRDFGGNDAEAMRALGIASNAETPQDYDELAALIRNNQEERGKDQGTADVAPGDDEDPEVGDTEPRSSWWFRDLGPVLAGENPEPEPSVLARADGRCLFYPGKVNGILGPSESGKSWLALLAVAQELAAGRPVLYMDFEDTAPGIISRLRSLGVADELMEPSANLLAYVGPEEGLGPMSKVDLAEVLCDRPWSLIVLDGVNAAMTQIGLDLMSNTDATKFFTQITRPFSITGAAVVTIDHVPKNTENRSKGGIGAQAKRATVTGSAVYVDVVEAFGRGRSGRLSLIIDKDRPGHVRGTTNAVDVWADATLKASEDGDLSISLQIPEDVAKETGVLDRKADEFRVKVSEFMANTHKEMSRNEVEMSVSGTASKIREALVWLVEQGYVNRRLGGNNGKTQLHSHQREYRGAVVLGGLNDLLEGLDS